MTWRTPKPPVDLHNPKFFDYAADQYCQMVVLTCRVLNDCAPILQWLQPDIRAAVAAAVANTICNRNLVFLTEDFNAQPTALPPEKAKEVEKIVEGAKKNLQA